MEHLTKLFKLLELTRSQPQTGYALAGIGRTELSNLAEHHYLVAIFAWQIALSLNRAGANLDLVRVLEFALVHDLGELLGGDIAMPYAKANRRAYRAAKAFEKENQKFLAKFFGSGKNHFLKRAAEILEAKSDEAFVAKFADYVECTHYKQYASRLKKQDMTLAREKCGKLLKKIKNPIARSELQKFLPLWLADLPKTAARFDEIL